MLGIDGKKHGKRVGQVRHRRDEGLDLGSYDAGQGLRDVDLVEAVFKQADKDNGGTIEAGAQRVLGRFGLMPTEPHVKAAIEGDTLTKMKDGIGRKDKKLDLPEFQRLVKDLLDGARGGGALAEVMVRSRASLSRPTRTRVGRSTGRAQEGVGVARPRHGQDVLPEGGEEVRRRRLEDARPRRVQSVVGHLMGAQESTTTRRSRPSSRAPTRTRRGHRAADSAACSASWDTTSARSTWRTSQVRRRRLEGALAKEFKAVIASILGAADDGEGRRTTNGAPTRRW